MKKLLIDASLLGQVLSDLRDLCDDQREQFDEIARPLKFSKSATLVGYLDGRGRFFYKDDPMDKKYPMSQRYPVSVFGVRSDESLHCKCDHNGPCDKCYGSNGGEPNERSC